MKFDIVKKGYDTIAVDKRIDELESVIQSYKEKDLSIKNAILNAQIAADNIILNSKKQAEEIKKNTESQVQSILDTIANQKNNVVNFQNDYNLLIRKYLQNVNESDIAAINSKIDDLSDYFKKYQKEIENTTDYNSDSKFGNKNNADNEAKKELLGK